MQGRRGFFTGGKYMTSRARRNGVCNYRLWTTEELIDSYAFEATRIDQKDRETTQRLIKEELKRRFETILGFLDGKPRSGYC